MKNFDASFVTPVIQTSKQMRHIVPNHPALISGASCRPFGTRAETPWFRRALLPICAAALVNLVACTTQSSSISLQGKPLSGYVRMTQVQAAYLGSGSAGNGVLRYKGSSYPFSVGGLGVGGIGLSKIEAKGEVYGLQRLRDFPGAYVQGRYGFALGNKSAGDLWLQNGNGVIMRLVAKRQGLMLSLGGDAVVIQNEPVTLRDLAIRYAMTTYLV
jgi:hypothetical protein